MYRLYFGNQNYSSWSLRPWLLLKHFGIAFEEHKVEVRGQGPNDRHRAYSANGLVPCLHVNGFQVWDTLAIAEFLAERHTGLWPDDPMARARARSVSAEMHSGFSALRGAMPMNIKLRLKGTVPGTDVASDIARIAGLWTDARAHFGGQDEPWLFGRFSIADAMFAPIVWRFNTYNVKLPEVAAEYRDAMLNHPAMKEWEAAALVESEVLPDYDGLSNLFGGPR